mmetsp:Transcript_14051/g.19548  ORF Transcript_14051/g.19548 Transcript_14051/m.19548 type:complete len:87 (+) Transcript_14051:1761-2021(+)
MPFPRSIIQEKGQKVLQIHSCFQKLAKKRILSSNFPSKIEKTAATTPDFGGVYVQFKKSSMIKDLEKMNRFYQRCLTVKKSRTQSE